MKNIKKIIKSILITITTFIILITITTILNYYNLIKYKNIIMLMTVITSMFIGGYWIGKQTIKNGWLEGLKTSTIISLIMIITTILLKEFTIKYLIYIMIITSSGIFGSILGIDKNENNIN